MIPKPARPEPVEGRWRNTRCFDKLSMSGPQGPLQPPAAQSTCGCGTHWQTLGQDFGKMGVNARLLDGFDEAAIEVRKFDNRG